MGRFSPQTNDEVVAAQIVMYARKTDNLAELCDLIDYDTDKGPVEPHWVPKLHVLTACCHVLVMSGVHVEVI